MQGGGNDLQQNKQVLGLKGDQNAATKAHFLGEFATLATLIVAKFATQWLDPMFPSLQQHIYAFDANKAIFNPLLLGAARHYDAPTYIVPRLP